MAGKRKEPATKKPSARKPAAKKAVAVPELIHEEGYWWVVKGTTRVNVGRNKRYAEAQFEEMTR